MPLWIYLKRDSTRKQKAESRKQKAEGRKQKAEGSRQKAESSPVCSAYCFPPSAFRFALRVASLTLDR